MKKALAVIFSISFMLITGCNGAADYYVNQTNLELSVMIDGMGNSLLHNITDAFQNAYPEIKLNVFVEEYYKGASEILNWNEIAPKVDTEIMAGKGPDIFIVGTWGILGDLNKTMKAGTFYDLNNILNKTKSYDENDYLKPAITAGQYQNGQYIFPIAIETPLLVTTEETVAATQIDLSNCTDYFGLMNEIDKYHKNVGANNQRISFSPHPLNNFALMNAYDNEVKFDTDEVRKAITTYKECERNSTLYGRSVIGESNFSKFLSERIIFSDEHWGYDGLNLVSQLAEIYEPILLPKCNSHGQIQTEIEYGIAVNAASPNIANVEKFFEIMLTNNESVNALDDETHLEWLDDLDAREREKWSKFYERYSGIPEEERYRFEGIMNLLPVKKSAFMRNFECKQKQLSDGYIYNTYDDVYENRAIKINPLDKVYYKQFEDIYNNIEVCILPSRDIDKQVYSYFEPYFNDEATLEACIETAQSAMEIYISE